MRNRIRCLVLAAGAIWALSPAILAQTPARPGAGAPTAPPDLAGIWSHAGQSVDGSPTMGFLWSEAEPAMLPWAQERYK
ncbi:MAG: hypothetical protein ACRD88_12240, partial [Terriglobia bacterium]